MELNNDTYDGYYDYYYESDNSTAEEFYPNLTKVVEFLDTYYLPMVIIVGLLANILSFVVFVSTYLNRLSLSVYLAALALVDSGFLCALAVGWLDYVGIGLFHTNGWCQVTVFTSYVCSFLSAWLVVSFTVERYIAICHPLRRPEMCTVRRARIVTVCLSGFALLGYSITLRITGVDSIGKFIVCQPLTEYSYLYRVLTYLDAVVTFVVPFLAILGFNIRIFKKIAYFYSKRKNEPGSNHIYCLTSDRDHSTSNRVCLRNRAQVKMTKFLLIISTVFLVINLPAYSIRVIAFFNNIMAKANTRYQILLQQLFQFLFYLNFSVNFFLYSICSKKFREALLRLFRQIRYKLDIFFRESYRLWATTSP